MAANIVRHHGHLPLIPHLSHYYDDWHYVYYGYRPEYEFYMDLSLELVRRSDGLVYLDPSRGADRELALARELGLPIWTSPFDVPLIRNTDRGE